MRRFKDVESRKSSSTNSRPTLALQHQTSSNHSKLAAKYYPPRIQRFKTNSRSISPTIFSTQIIPVIHSIDNTSHNILSMTAHQMYRHKSILIHQPRATVNQPEERNKKKRKKKEQGTKHRRRSVARCLSVSGFSRSRHSNTHLSIHRLIKLFQHLQTSFMNILCVSYETF